MLAELFYKTYAFVASKAFLDPPACSCPPTGQPSSEVVTATRSVPVVTVYATATAHVPLDRDGIFVLVFLLFIVLGFSILSSLLVLLRKTDSRTALATGVRAIGTTAVSWIDVTLGKVVKSPYGLLVSEFIADQCKDCATACTVAIALVNRKRPLALVVLGEGFSRWLALDLLRELIIKFRRARSGPYTPYGRCEHLLLTHRDAGADGSQSDGNHSGECLDTSGDESSSSDASPVQTSSGSSSPSSTSKSKEPSEEATFASFVETEHEDKDPADLLTANATSTSTVSSPYSNVSNISLILRQFSACRAQDQSLWDSVTEREIVEGLQMATQEHGAKTTSRSSEDGYSAASDSDRRAMLGTSGSSRGTGLGSRTGSPTSVSSFRAEDFFPSKYGPCARVNADGTKTDVTCPYSPDELDVTLIGHGGYGMVFKLTPRNSGRVFAVKRVFGEHAAPEHKNLATITKLLDESGSQHSLPFVRLQQAFEFANSFVDLFMEYIEGPNLETYQTSLAMQNIRISLVDIGIIMCQLIAGFAWLHKNKLVHSDIKPGNIALSWGKYDLDPREATARGVEKVARLEDPTVVILDYGMVVEADTSQKEFGGTFGYKSPEVVLGVDSGLPQDCWSMGVLALILFAPLTSFYPSHFKESMSSEDMEYQHLQFLCHRLLQTAIPINMARQTSRRGWFTAITPSSRVVPPGDNNSPVYVLKNKLRDHEYGEFSSLDDYFRSETSSDTLLMLKSFIRGFLVFDPADRMSMETALTHPFIVQGGCDV